MPSFQLDNGGPVITWKDTDYNIVGSKWEKGWLGSGEWVVRYTKGNSSSTQNFRVSSPINSSGGTAMGGYKINK